MNCCVSSAFALSLSLSLHQKASRKVWFWKVVVNSVKLFFIQVYVVASKHKAMYEYWCESQRGLRLHRSCMS